MNNNGGVYFILFFFSFLFIQINNNSFFFFPSFTGSIILKFTWRRGGFFFLNQEFERRKLALQKQYDRMTILLIEVLANMNQYKPIDRTDEIIIIIIIIKLINEFIQSNWRKRKEKEKKKKRKREEKKGIISPRQTQIVFYSIVLRIHLQSVLTVHQIFFFFHLSNFFVQILLSFYSNLALIKRPKDHNRHHFLWHVFVCLFVCFYLFNKNKKKKINK